MVMRMDNKEKNDPSEASSVPKKRSTKKLKQDVVVAQPVESNVVEETTTFDCIVQKKDFSRHGNRLFSAKRIDQITISTIALWINRFVIKDDDWRNSKWYSWEEINDSYIFRFAVENDQKRTQRLLNCIKDQGCPSHGQYY